MMIFLSGFLLFSQPAFNKVAYCHETTRGIYESQCVDLTPDGVAAVRFKRRGADEVKTSVTLSAAAREKFVGIVAATNNLADENCESKNKVADLGPRHLSVESSAGTKKCDYNFSVRPEVTALQNFMDGVVNAETISFEIDTMLQYDRLGVPKKLELIGNELKSNRIADPERLIPILDKIEKDTRLVNYARKIAGTMKEEITKKKR
jgi:hypothetical protein